MLYNALSVDAGIGVVDAISNYFTSDQAEEIYAFLSQSPMLREWVGGRNAKGLRENNFSIRNKHFEATLKVTLSQLRRDKSSQLQMRINELARRNSSHWYSLVSALLAAGETGVCYDGLYFFDTTHSEGDSGTQSNLLSIDISGFPIVTSGTATLPSVAAYQFAIAQCVQQIVGFKDDQGEACNTDARNFLVMCPVAHMNVAMQAVATPAQVAETQSALQALKGKFSISVEPIVGLSTWTDSFAVSRTDSNFKPFIRQQETDISIKTKGEGSDYEFDNDAHMHGIDVWRNAGYGDWKNIVKATMV
jgi:phage major head subunit gpT-like protein